MLNRLNEKLKEIKSEKDKALANLNCLIGAEQMLIQLINEEKESEREESDNADDSY
ncbi:MAG: hypothetical protein ACI4I3_06065 [Acutalibacteraceae bacterium]